MDNTMGSSPDRLNDMIRANEVPFTEGAPATSEMAQYKDKTPSLFQRFGRTKYGRPLLTAVVAVGTFLGAQRLASPSSVALADTLPLAGKSTLEGANLNVVPAAAGPDDETEVAPKPAEDSDPTLEVDPNSIAAVEQNIDGTKPDQQIEDGDTIRIPLITDDGKLATTPLAEVMGVSLSGSNAVTEPGEDGETANAAPADVALEAAPKAPINILKPFEAPTKPVEVVGNLNTDGIQIESMGKLKLKSKDVEFLTTTFREIFSSNGAGIQILIYDKKSDIPAQFNAGSRNSMTIFEGFTGVKLGEPFTFSQGNIRTDKFVVVAFAPESPMERDIKSPETGLDYSPKYIFSQTVLGQTLGYALQLNPQALDKYAQKSDKQEATGLYRIVDDRSLYIEA